MWEDNIKIDLKDVGLEDVNWINLTKKTRPVACSCKHGNESYISI
jgi:hypothetical protein